MSDRIYTEKEVAAIFARAAEHQRSRSKRDAAAGLTLKEIEEVGLEAGLDAGVIRAAANDLDVQQQYPEHPRITVMERWVEKPLPVGAWEDLVASLRHKLGTNYAWWGKDTATLGDAHEWTHTSASGVQTTVTVSPRDDRTLLRVVQEDSGMDDERTMGWLVAAVVGLVPAVLTGALVAEVLAFGDLAGIAAMMLVFVVALTVGGPALTASVRKSRERRPDRVRQLADDLRDQVLSMQVHGAERVETDSILSDEESLLDLPPAVEEPETLPRSERRRAGS